MKVSFEWLSEWIEWIETNPQVIADRLTAATGEVDNIERQGEYLDHCVVGSITSLRKHPGADRLSLCDVQTDAGEKHVVCGGTNLRMGQLVAFAHVGATVKWHGQETMTLAPVKIRGEVSEGMICAAEELGLESLVSVAPDGGEHPIVDISDRGFPVGMPLREALKQSDTIFHIDNHAITNRPDLFSQRGIARECVALGLARWRAEPKKTAYRFPQTQPPFAFRNDVPTLVPVYRSCLVEIDGIGETPEWMKRRLAAVGVRSLNLPIDITNYVMLETGMPLHAFDVDDIRESLTIRLARAGETVITLDGKKRNLPEGAIVMSDAEGVFDLLGIMGGLRSSTKEGTRRLYLHAAAVDPVAVRRTVIATGLRTDAATIYEKDVQAITVEEGFMRALELILTLVPGARIASQQRRSGELPEPKAIPLDLSRVVSTIGVPLTRREVVTILTSLDCEIKGGTSKKESAPLLVTPPLHRLHDIQGEHDLIEEVARIYGYSAVVPVMPSAAITLPPRETRIHDMRNALQSQSYREFLHLSFVSPSMLAKAGLSAQGAVALENPLGEELSLMRTSLLPAMLETAGTCMREQGTTLKAYEYGTVFSDRTETPELCMLMAKAKRGGSLLEEIVLTLKADLNHACSVVGLDVSCEQRENDLPPFAHPGRSATLNVSGREVGILCDIHPSIARHFDLEDRVGVAILNLQELMSLPSRTLVAAPLATFPAIQYDETIPLSRTLSARALIERTQSSHPLLESVSIEDLFRNERETRVTLRFVYRSPDRTLEQKEIDDIHKRVLQGIRS